MGVEATMMPLTVHSWRVRSILWRGRMAFLRRRQRDSVNTVLGDESFIRTFGRKPDARTDEALRVRTHLAYVERLLREKPTPHLSEELRQARAAMLDLLHQYWVAGVFPSNTNPAYRGTRRPCFIDASGTICAVGYLVERTAGRNLAESINRQWHSAFVSEMVEPSIEAWMERSGLTVEEFAMIQPGYWAGYDEDEEYRQYLERKRDVEEKEYRQYLARNRDFNQVSEKDSTLAELDERIKFLERVYEQALFRPDFVIASLVRVELIDLRKARERIVATTLVNEPPLGSGLSPESAKEPLAEHASNEGVGEEPSGQSTRREVEVQRQPSAPSSIELETARVERERRTP